MKIHNWDFEQNTTVWFDLNDGGKHTQQLNGSVFLIELTREEYQELVREGVIDPVKRSLDGFFKALEQIDIKRS